MVKRKKAFFTGIGFVISFVVWTLFVRFVDVKAIGPQGSCVGFASLNGLIHDLIGQNMWLYVLTDWLGLVPIGIAFIFAVLGLIQWINRKSFGKVDYDILALGGFYIAVIAIYVLFEYVTINYRPVLIDGYLESSYPSSTTMLVTCVMPTAIMQFYSRIKNKTSRRYIIFLLVTFTLFMVLGRIISGVHWITDIIGGALISAGLVLIYYSVCNLQFPKS